jgi:orotate phosphoribosyltransferase
MNQEEIVGLLEQQGVIERGHFLLSSGRHSDTYLQTARILQFPELAKKLAKEIAENYPQVDVVLAPALGGIILGFAVAEALGCRMIFAERENGEMKLRRGFDLKKDERVLVVEDVVTTGKSIKELLDIVKEKKAKLAGIVALVDRGDQKAFSEVPVSLVKLSIKSYSPEQCPLCRAEQPLVAPGSSQRA